MPATLPPLPQPLPPQVARFDAQGKPTQAQVDFERRMTEWLRALAVAVKGG